MSFKLVEKKLKSKEPIAKVRGGKQDGWYLYLDDFKFTLKNIPSEMYKDLNEKQQEEIEKALHSGYEPDDEELTKIFYNFKEYIKKTNCKLILRQGGKFEYLPSMSYIERVICCGISCSGKSTWCSRYVYNWKKKKGGNSKKARPWYIVSNVDEDEVLDKLDPERLDINELASEGIDIEKITDALILVDDVSTIENAPVRRSIRSCVDNLLQVSRHYGTFLLITSHHIQNYHETRTQLLESNIVVLFPHNNSRCCRNYLKGYEYFTEDQINRVMNIKSRWIALIKHIKPQFIMTEHSVFII